MSESDGFLDDADDDDDGDEPIEVEAQEVSSGGMNAEPPQEASNTLLKPASDDLEEIAAVYDQFERIKTQLLTKDDMENIQDSMFITKSGWRKIATAFNVSVEATEKEKVIEDGVVRWRVTARAVAPNGKSATGMAMCGSNESNHMEFMAKGNEEKPEGDNIFKVDGHWRRLKDPREVDEHNIYATAETRAKNRAISDLVGGGEVSAEELSSDKFF